MLTAAACSPAHATRAPRAAELDLDIDPSAADGPWRKIHITLSEVGRPHAVGGSRGELHASSHVRTRIIDQVCMMGGTVIPTGIQAAVPADPEQARLYGPDAYLVTAKDAGGRRVLHVFSGDGSYRGDYENGARRGSGAFVPRMLVDDPHEPLRRPRKVSRPRLTGTVFEARPRVAPNPICSVAPTRRRDFPSGIRTVPCGGSPQGTDRARNRHPDVGARARDRSAPNAIRLGTSPAIQAQRVLGRDVRSSKAPAGCIAATVIGARPSVLPMVPPPAAGASSVPPHPTLPSRGVPARRETSVSALLSAASHVSGGCLPIVVPDAVQPQLERARQRLDEAAARIVPAWETAPRRRQVSALRSTPLALGSRANPSRGSIAQEAARKRTLLPSIVAAVDSGDIPMGTYPYETAQDRSEERLFRDDLRRSVWGWRVKALVDVLRGNLKQRMREKDARDGAEWAAKENARLQRIQAERQQSESWRAPAVAKPAPPIARQRPEVEAAELAGFAGRVRTGPSRWLQAVTDLFSRRDGKSAGGVVASGALA